MRHNVRQRDVLIDRGKSRRRPSAGPTDVGPAGAETEAEDVRPEAEQTLRTIFDATSDGIFLQDLETRQLTMCNKSCLHMLGYTQEEFLKLRVADLHLEADLPFIYAQIEEFLKGGTPVRHDIRFKRKDGSIFFADVSPDLVLLDGKRYALVALKDITERKRMEQELQRYAEHLEELVAARTAELQESEARYRSLYHTIADGIFVIGADGRIEDVNDSACAQLGHTRAELIGMPVAAISAGPGFHLGEILDRLRAAGSLSYETTHRRKDGAVIPVELSVTPVEYRGQPAVLGVARDITKRKQAEEALRQLSRKNEEALQVARMGHWEFDITTGRFTFNDQYYALHGATGPEAGGYQMTAEEFARRYVHPDDAHLVQETIQKAAAVEDPDFQFQTEARILRADGEVRWVTVWFRIEKDAQGKTTKLYGVNQDITERKQAEEAVAESRQRYRGLVERINDWAWEVDADCVYTYASPRAGELLGYAPEEIVGKTPFDLMPPAEAQRVWNAFQPIWREHKPLEQLENTLVRKDGGLVTVETSGMPVFAEDGAFLGYMGIDRDVTARKQAQEALREKEHLLSESQRIGRIGTWSADPATGAATWTPETYRLFGVSPETFVPVADAMIDLLHPDDRDAMREWIRAAVAGEHPGVLEFRVVLPDGSVRTLSGRGELIPAGDHKPVRLVGTTQDVTERKRAEEALRQLSRKDEEALQVARMGHWEFDLTTGMFIFNDQYYTLHGTTARDAGGYQMTAEQFARRYVHPDDAHLVQETIQEAAAVEDPNFQFQTVARILCADGEPRWVTVWFRIEKDAEGRTTKLYGVNQDITDRQQAEEALQESEERYRILLEQGFDGIFVHEDYRIVQLNNRLTQMTGYSRAELLGTLALDLVTPRSQERVRQYIHAGADGYLEIELRHRDGRIVEAEAFGVPCQFQGRPARIVGLRDITERKQAQEALRRLNEQLELQVAQRTDDLRHTVERLRELTLELSQAEDRERRRIADILHEDVQQMLAAAKFHLNLLDSEPRSAEESREIVTQVKHMLKEAIEKSRSLSHELSPALYQVDLAAILEWLARHMQQKHGLTVRVEAHGPVDSPSEPLKAFLYKVAQELLFNVVKHAGINEARIRVRRWGPWIYLSVADRGQGFDPRQLEGTAGFGLLGIRERVQLLGGRMKIRSASGMGSSLLIAVPDEAATQAR